MSKKLIGMQLKSVLVGCVLIMSLSACSNMPINSNTAKIQKDHPQEVVVLKKGLEIYFKNKSMDIDEQYKTTLAVAAQLLNSNKNFILQIDGHTDSSGSLVANTKVSTTRANFVKDFIAHEYTVNPEQLIATGLGPTKPIASNTTADGRAKNRRVTVTLRIQ